MSKNVKTKWLAARTDGAMDRKVTTYIAQAAQIEGMGDLVRKAVDEYIENHPVVMKSQEKV